MPFLPEKLIIELYQQGWSITAIAKKVGTGIPPRGGQPRRERIRVVLRRAGVYRQPNANLQKPATPVRNEPPQHQHQ
jgi:hypothetical protein